MQSRNIVYAFQNFDPATFSFHFFDTENETTETSDLYFIGLSLFQLMDLFYGVNQDSGAITFSKDFLRNMKILKTMIDSLQARAKKEALKHGIVVD